MDLPGIRTVVRPRSRAELAWGPGHAWLAGGTWLFSQPQGGVDTLVDLEGLGWAALEADEGGLTIGATCPNGALVGFEAPGDWRAAGMFRSCCLAFQASFKVWSASTVGGNLVMALPAGPMIALTAALEGVCTLWPQGGGAREVAVMDFVVGDHRTVLGPGELLRSVRLPVAALRRRSAFRQVSLTKLGRSAALLIGTAGDGGDLVLTITAATDRPVQVRFSAAPDAAALRAALAAVPAGRWFGDAHGTAEYKRHVTGYLAESIRRELVGG